MCLQRDALIRDGVFYPSGADAYVVDLTTGAYVRYDGSTVFGGPYIIHGNRGYDWHITDEVAMIGGMQCSKAMPMGEQSPIVWIADDLPLSVGPEAMSRLPGAIVSMRWGNYSYNLAQISTDSHIKEIELEKQGKTCTEEEYEAMVNAILDPLMENGGGTMEVGGGTLRIIK